MKRSCYGIIVWFIVTLFVIYAFSLNTASAVFKEAIKNSLHTDDISVTYAMSAFIIGFACTQIPAGYLLDRFNVRWVVSTGVMLLTFGNILISFSHHLVLFSLANFIQGVGGSFAFIAAGVLISQWFSEKSFPVLFGLTQTLSCVLTGIIHYVMVEMLKMHSWNTLYQYLAIYGVILLILTILFVKSPTENKITQAPILSLKASLSEVCTNKQIILCTFAAATSFGVLLAYASFWYMSIQQHYSVETRDTFVIGGLFFAGMGIGTPILGVISNVLKSRIMVIHVSLSLGTMLLLAGIYLPHFEIDSFIIIKVISFFIGFFLSGSMLFYTVVSETATNNTRGVALSVTNTGVFLFNTIMLFAPYLLINKTSQTFFTYLWIFPFFILISILLLYFINETYRSSSSKEVL